MTSSLVVGEPPEHPRVGPECVFDQRLGALVTVRCVGARRRRRSQSHANSTAVTGLVRTGPSLVHFARLASAAAGSTRPAIVVRRCTYVVLCIPANDDLA